MKTIVLAISMLLSINYLAMSQTQVKKEKETLVLIQTDMGDITVKLYNETPLHRDNFIKLVKNGFYNGPVFHRVIKDFMIQGGGAAEGKEDAGYTIKAEFVSKYFHKKGALAAARMGDAVNPNKESSSSQFYIVQGRKFTAEQLSMMGQSAGKTFPAEQVAVYSTLGGTPHLDGGYTVFGEVVAGLDVVDRIAAVQTAAADRPVKDVTMKMKLLN